jgi:hypothetical protein
MSDEQWTATVVSRRRDLIGALTETVLARPMSPLEHTAIDTALAATMRGNAVPILPMIVDHLLAPAHDDDGRLKEDGRMVGHALRRLVAGDRAALATPEGWRTLVVESLRITTDSDFRRLAGSAAWRDHLALGATCSTLPEGDLRDAVAAELAASERAFTDRRARVYGRLPAVLGYRLVPWLDPADGFTRMAEATGAMMTGLVARAAVVPPGPTTPMRAFGSGALAPWTTEAYAVTATILAFLEPDPDVVWDAARLDLAVARSAGLEREARLLRRE